MAKALKVRVNCKNSFIEFIVDMDHKPLIDKYNWFLGKTGYIVCNNPGKKQTYLHRMVLNTDSCVDHINGDRLDNRRCNLRVCNQSQNQANRKINKNNISGYKGVSWYKAGQKFSARIGVNYKSVFLGYFKTKEEAAKAYNEAALKYFGEFARLNKV